MAQPAPAALHRGGRVALPLVDASDRLALAALAAAPALDPGADSAGIARGCPRARGCLDSSSRTDRRLEQLRGCHACAADRPRPFPGPRGCALRAVVGAKSTREPLRLGCFVPTGAATREP